MCKVCLPLSRVHTDETVKSQQQRSPPLHKTQNTHSTQHTAHNFQQRQQKMDSKGFKSFEQYIYDMQWIVNCIRGDCMTSDDYSLMGFIEKRIQPRSQDYYNGIQFLKQRLKEQEALEPRKLDKEERTKEKIALLEKTYEEFMINAELFKNVLRGFSSTKPSSSSSTLLPSPTKQIESATA